MAQTLAERQAKFRQKQKNTMKKLEYLLEREKNIIFSIRIGGVSLIISREKRNKSTYIPLRNEK